jgi:2-polyprenyl-6-hydroxyphenyl methylase / 3-demethylubiquinone-9 3-methyltransferase
MRQAQPTDSPSVDPAEIARFAQLSASWWDDHGPFAPLHRLNPARLKVIRDHAVRHFARDGMSMRPLAGLDAVDVGCGGGLIAEPLARMGARVVAIDAGEDALGAARSHAEEAGLTIDYRLASAEALAQSGARFDLVVCLEVVEHVADLDGFLAAIASLVRPGGLAVLATINRTPEAFALAIIGAEYILGWLPRGTHDWRRFVRPSELARGLRRHRIEVGAMTGLAYRPFSDVWVETTNLSVNYMIVATRPHAI